MSETLYNTIGKGYNTTRKADPYIAGRLHELLSPVPGGIYLDIGCGTGNYLVALTQKGLNMRGADPSATMLQEAREKNPGAALVCANVENLPFDNDSFDGSIATFTFHHWTDKRKGLDEMHRVLKPGARLVFLSFTPEQMRGYWLYHYFPEMIQRSWELVPGIGGMEKLLNESGFQQVTTEKYFVQDDLQDHFLYSNKYRPEAYLDEDIRKGISSFAAFSTPGEVAAGLKALEADIETGAVKEIINSYENEHGDYLFYIAENKA